MNEWIPDLGVKGWAAFLGVAGELPPGWDVMGWALLYTEAPTQELLLALMWQALALALSSSLEGAAQVVSGSIANLHQCKLYSTSHLDYKVTVIHPRHPVHNLPKCHPASRHLPPVDTYL